MTCDSSAAVEGIGSAKVGGALHPVQSRMTLHAGWQTASSFEWEGDSVLGS